MLEKRKSKNYWAGLVTFVYSLFLFIQGFWVWANYSSLYPVVLDPIGIVPNSDWVFQMIGALAPSIIGGLIFMMVGRYISGRGDEPKLAVSLSLVGFSLILIVQTVWIFTILAYRHELLWYFFNNIFTNYPRFFMLLGVVIPPILGSVVFLVAGLVEIKLTLELRKR